MMKTRGSQKLDALCRARSPRSHKFCLYLASACGVEVGSVYDWRRGSRPTIERAAIIERVTDGAVQPGDWMVAADATEARP